MSNSLIEKFAETLEHIDHEAVLAYEQSWPLIVDSVNQEMQQREDLPDLIGPNPIKVMVKNHEHHAQFILSQFRMKSARTLVDTIIWVYQSYTKRGFSPTYFPIELHAWQKAMERHIDARNYAILNTLYQLMRDSHRDFLFFSQTPHSPINFEQDETLLPYFTRYLDALLEPDVREAVQVSQEYIKTVWDIPVWWERIICPAMYEIGWLWSDGQITVGQEHMATSITQRVISVHYPKILELPRNKGVIVVAVSPDELHEIGARMVADMLEMHGWDVHYTGANTPSESLINLIKQEKVRYLCISTTLPTHLIHVEHIIKHVKSTNLEKQPHIIVGGQAYLHDPDLWKFTGADSFVMSAKESIHYIQSLENTRSRNGHN